MCPLSGFAIMPRPGYIHLYFGKEEKGKSTDLISMAFEYVLGYNERNKKEKYRTAQKLSNLFLNDRELFEFTLGILFKKWSM